MLPNGPVRANVPVRAGSIAGQVSRARPRVPAGRWSAGPRDGQGGRARRSHTQAERAGRAEAGALMDQLAEPGVLCADGPHLAEGSRIRPLIPGKASASSRQPLILETLREDRVRCNPVAAPGRCSNIGAPGGR